MDKQVCPQNILLQRAGQFGYRNLKELPDIYDRRLAACGKLESAETALMKTAAKLRLVAIKASNKKGSKGEVVTEDVEASRTPDHALVPQDKRPQHRLGMIPFVGKKVDTIDWAREEIRVCTELLDEGRAVIENDGRGVKDASKDTREVEAEETGEAAESTSDKDKDKDGKGKDKPKSYPPLNSAFITFHKQIAAHLAMQVLTHHEPYRMSEFFISISTVYLC